MWNTQERRLFDRLRQPHQIQRFLDDLSYNVDDHTRSVRSALAVKKAHCFDGALIASAVFEYHGRRPLLLDLRANDNDDDHILALYRVSGYWGAVAKSNFSGLRFREPVYRSPRELAVSYFEDFFNLAGEKTLREYSTPFNLLTVRDVDWRWGDFPVDEIGERIDRLRHFPLIDRRREQLLAPVDPRSMAAGMVGLNRKGAFGG